MILFNNNVSYTKIYNLLTNIIKIKIFFQFIFIFISLWKFCFIKDVIEELKRLDNEFNNLIFAEVLIEIKKDRYLLPFFMSLCLCFSFLILLLFFVLSLQDKKKGTIKTLSNETESKFYYLFTLIVCTLFIFLIAIFTKLLVSKNIRSLKGCDQSYTLSNLIKVYKDKTAITKMVTIYYLLFVFCFVIVILSTMFITSSYITK